MCGCTKSKNDFHTCSALLHICLCKRSRPANVSSRSSASLFPKTVFIG
ncbi:hypothetical protein OIU74_022517 [Salix koriyanagi]|uniref:Uncharacterized protein n=1 Tax=Salix koriyanagi TaxID=2511006 RepID=A0A9Q0WKF8_9ROSI|nr:hypothetical protein OIU74_022517 [Salix koriyanagi]